MSSLDTNSQPIQCEVSLQGLSLGEPNWEVIIKPKKEIPVPPGKRKGKDLDDNVNIPTFGTSTESKKPDGKKLWELMERFTPEELDVFCRTSDHFDKLFDELPRNYKPNELRKKMLDLMKVSPKATDEFLKYANEKHRLFEDVNNYYDEDEEQSTRGFFNLFEGSQKQNPEDYLKNYYALIIGINAYNNLKTLKTAVKDAQDVDKVLKQKYGFKTQLLLDKNATRDNILEVINDYRRTLYEKDNFLIYYAGHGKYDKKLINPIGYL